METKGVVELVFLSSVESDTFETGLDVLFLFNLVAVSLHHFGVDGLTLLADSGGNDSCFCIRKMAH